MATHSLEHLRTFLTAYRVGSLSEAAKLLGISQPTASAHVHALEENLGVALFERTASGVSPTPKAVGLARQIDVHIDALDDLAYMSALTGGSASIDVGGPAEILTTLLLPHACELMEAASARLRISFGLADDLLERLKNGDLDVVISAVQPRIKGIAGIPIYDEEFILVGAPDWKTGPADPKAPGAGLEAIPVVTYAENLPIIRRYWRSVFGHRPDHLRSTLVVPDLRAVLAVVRSEAGMSVLPQYLVGADLASGALVVLNTPDMAPLNTVYLATRSGEIERNWQIRGLVDMITSLAKSW